MLHINTEFTVFNPGRRKSANLTGLYIQYSTFGVTNFYNIILNILLLLLFADININMK